MKRVHFLPGTAPSAPDGCAWLCVVDEISISCGGSSDRPAVQVTFHVTPTLVTIAEAEVVPGNITGLRHLGERVPGIEVGIGPFERPYIGPPSHRPDVVLSEAFTEEELSTSFKSITQARLPLALPARERAALCEYDPIEREWGPEATVSRIAACLVTDGAGPTFHWLNEFCAAILQDAATTGGQRKAANELIRTIGALPGQEHRPPSRLVFNLEHAGKLIATGSLLERLMAHPGAEKLLEMAKRQRVSLEASRALNSQTARERGREMQDRLVALRVENPRSKITLIRKRVAREFGVSLRTVYEHTRNGRLPRRRRKNF